MKTLLLTIGFVLTGLLTSFAEAQTIPLTIDSSQSSVVVSIDGNASSSSLSGDATFELQSSGPPSGTAQVTDLNLVLNDGLSFRFFIFVGVSSSPGDVNISMVTPGNAGTISGSTFDQLANSLALGGGFSVADPLGLAGGDQTLDLSEIELGLVDFNSVNVTQSGDVVTVSSTATINETVELGAGNMDLVVEVTYVATGDVPEIVLLGDVNLDGVVNFLDISPFISILTTGGFQVEADIDQNGAVNFLDISPFIVLLSN